MIGQFNSKESENKYYEKKSRKEIGVERKVCKLKIITRKKKNLCQSTSLTIEVSSVTVRCPKKI